MVVHAIVDYSFLYYKYKFQLDSGKIRRLTTPMNWKGTVIEKDISQIYYSIKEIEGFRRKLEQAGHEVCLSVCFDMPSSRKAKTEESDQKSEQENEAAGKYKSNRVKRLNEEDFENIQFVKELLHNAGYNTYKYENYEADDIVAHLIDNYKQSFDYSIIYTPDLDLMVHIADNVGVQRYKAMKGYANISESTFTVYLENELKCQMPYNALTLFKATVGDKSDCIDGIKKFGPKAFDKLVNYLNETGVDWSLMKDCGQVENILNQLLEKQYLSKEQHEQAIQSLSLVRPMKFKDGVVPYPSRRSTREMREMSYMTYGMKSLVD